MVKSFQVIGFFLWIGIASCSNDSRYYFHTTSRHGEDSVYFILSKKVIDSVQYLEYKFSEHNTHKFKFNLKDKLQASNIGVEKQYVQRHFQDLEYSFLFLSDTTIYVYNKTYYIRKYLHELESANDHGAYYFWSPSLGIILIKSRYWNIKNSLQSHNERVNDTLTKLLISINNW